MITVFAWLMERRMSVVLDFLENINIHGQNGLQILMKTWCDHFQDFHGYYATRLW